MKQSNFAIIGAVFTALLSTLCCLPAFLFLFFGISSGVLSFFTTLEFTRVPLLLLTIFFLVFAIFNFKRKISCKYSKKEKIKNYLLFSLFFIFILLLLFYPEIIPLFME
ncbi:putative mercuric transport protein MerT [Aliarcobacter faecis]|uniref:transporter n=1 Tax=Aliarcobacter faecis TaxID=1564138 RepID=UPI00047CD44E|nr:transporter [Aliarcobacter faecis]QKF72966.1 putative mercuric transport protein MerT [Aliarcobacter faecis]